MSDQLYRRTVNNPIAEGVNVTVTTKDGTIIDGHVRWVPVERCEHGYIDPHYCGWVRGQRRVKCKGAELKVSRR